MGKFWKAIQQKTEALVGVVHIAAYLMHSRLIIKLWSIARQVSLRRICSLIDNFREWLPTFIGRNLKGRVFLGHHSAMYVCAICIQQMQRRTSTTEQGKGRNPILSQNLTGLWENLTDDERILH